MQIYQVKLLTEFRCMAAVVITDENIPKVW
jgi:hypothetical protein